MQDTLRKRLEQLRAQQRQGETMLINLQNEVTMVRGSINEVTALLNHLIEEEKKAAEAKAKEEAKKAKSKSKKKPAPKVVSPVPADAVTQDQAA